MSFAAASRRKQSKPQKVGTENDRDDSGILTSANSVSPEPVSIEEQFRNQLLSSLDKSSFFMNEDGHDNPTCMSLAKLKSRRIEEVLEEHSGSKIMVGDKANLLLNGLAHLSQQQLFEFCAASLAGNKDVLKEYENVQRNSSPPDLQSADAEKMIKNKWKEALEKESFKDDKPEVKCPVEECEFKANSTPLVLLHLFDVHKDSEKGGYLNCDTCGGCFKDLLEFRRHRCSSEFSATRPHSTAPSKCETEYEFPRQSESAPTLPNWTADNSFQLRNAEQQLNDLETTTAASSTYDDDNDDNGNNLPEPPLLLNEILGNQPSSNGSSVLDLSAKNVSTSNQIPNLLTNGPFLSSLNTTGIVPQFALSNSFDVPFGSPPMTPIVPSTSLVNDDDWESMMEISNTDENEKIRQLVGDKAAPPTDPNQCLLCRRVLSCKSALQMHYRTHTGERPFKCKICQRAFTTKGNLKTHMGVHRSKHSMRTISGSLQQCPICAKKFLNAAQLSQHMVNHQRPGIPNGSPGNAPFLFPGILGFNSFSNSALPLNLSPRFKEPPKTTPKLEPYDVMFAKKSSNDQQRGSSEDTKEEKMPLTPVVKKESTDVIVNGSNPLKHKLEKEKTSSSNASSTSETSPAKQPKLSNGDKPLLVVADEGYTENAIVNDNPLDAIQKMWKETEPNPPQRQQVTLSKHQCGVCFKHFSSSSALQIHMRTHTGDKPFKCNVCGRAFTTRGNLKVHMGTHSYSQSPSRRGRRIFDFTPELVARQQMLNQITANNVVASAASTPPFGFPMNFSPILAAALAAQQAQAQSCLPLNKESNEKSDDLSNGRNSIESMFWMLRGSNNCLICRKSCNSAQEMEKHLKAHLNGNPTDNNTNAIQLKTE